MSRAAINTLLSSRNEAKRKLGFLNSHVAEREEKLTVARNERNKMETRYHELGRALWALGYREEQK